MDTTNKPATDSLPPPTNLAPEDSLLIQSSSIPPNIVFDSSLVNSIHPFSMASGAIPLIKRRTDISFKPVIAEQQAPPSNVRASTGKDLLFYLLVALFILFAILRQAFSKYFTDLFRLFFKTTLKQRQVKEQLVQTPLPSLLLNGFFVITGALYIAFLMQHFGLNPVGNFWLMALYCGMGLSMAYFIKFAGLKICGWLFNMDDAANAYIFIVFLVNKMIGIMLLPFLLILAFSKDDVYTTGITLSWFVIGGMILYRFILTYSAIRNQVKVNPFHFLLYVGAFEIAPLLLVYKALLIFFNQTA